MLVTLNGEEKNVPEGVTVQQLLKQLALTSGPVAVEINRAVVPRAAHPVCVVQPGDAVEVVHLVGGG